MWGLMHQSENIKIKLVTIINKNEYSWLIFYCLSELMKTNSWTTAGQAKDISSSPNPLVKILRRGRHWVWESHSKYVLFPADKAVYIVVVVVGRLHYINTLIQELSSTKNGFLLTRDLLLIPILSILLLSLQWVLKKNKTDFLCYIGYRDL